jgi:hypothetical protein
MAEGFTSANHAAAQVINGELPAVAAENANYGAYQVDSAAGVGTSFGLQDEGTVHTLLSGSEAFLPQVAVAAAADIAWNRKGIQSAVTQGILLGESIPKIAKRMQSVGAQNRAQAVRWARTYTTAAENAGRVASYERAKGMGIKLKQEWLATLDGRTRHSHRQLDGEKREVGKKFSNGCRYPGDPQAAYAEICNCRCTLVAAVDGIDQDSADRFSRLPAGTTYEQWKAGKAESAHDSTGRTMAEFMQTPLVRKQLAKRGLTEAQGRKLLSEQLKADGATGHQFRTMTKQQQRKAWNGALREGDDDKGDSAKAIVRDAKYAINETVIGSKKYENKVRKVFGSTAAEAAVTTMRGALRHRRGTNGEDLYAIDLDSGRVISSVTTSETASEVLPTEHFLERVKAARGKGTRVAIMHNHPASGLPSAADLRSLDSYGGEFGAIACHDGSIYTYRRVSEGQKGYNLDKYTYNGVCDAFAPDGEPKVLAAVEERFGIRIEHIA